MKRVLLVIMLAVGCMFAGDSAGFEFPSWVDFILKGVAFIGIPAGVISYFSKVQGFMKKLTVLFIELSELLKEIGDADLKDPNSIKEIFNELEDIINLIKNWNIADSVKAIEKVTEKVKLTRHA